LAEAGEVNVGPDRPYLIGDANLDGFVDGLDFIVWNENRFTAEAAWCSGDFNADGFVDGMDFILWNENKFQASDQGVAFGELPLAAYDIAVRDIDWHAEVADEAIGALRLTPLPAFPELQRLIPHSFERISERIGESAVWPERVGDLFLLRKPDLSLRS
jgi:hypothetical protein